MIKAIKIVYENRPEIKLEIYGAGPEEENLKELTRQSGLEENIKILKPVPQDKLRNIYNRAGVVVLNSLNEGFGLVLTEAMLCQATIIGAKSGGITDIIKQGETGLLVPPENSVRLAEAIERLIEDDSLRERLAKSGYHRALKHFSSIASANQYARLYKSRLRDFRSF